jgi:curved DNA-binding protein
MDLNKNYYEILGVDKTANESEIKKSFRNLSKIHHPDKGGDSNKFKEINEASSVLSDSNQRIQYDNNSRFGASYNPNRNSGFGGFGGYDNPYSDFGFDMADFLRRAGFATDNMNYENLDINLDVKISLDDVYNNKSNSFKYKRRTKGENGSIVEKLEDLTIDNPFKLQGGQNRVQYNNLGNWSKNTDRTGNLVVNIYVVNSSSYERYGKDLLYNTKIDYLLAICGGKFEYTHLDGKKYSLTIPERMEDNTRLKMAKKGMLINNNGDRGDLYIDFTIKVDYSVITDNEVKILKTIKR